MAEFRVAAAAREDRPVSRTDVAAIIAIWLALGTGLSLPHPQQGCASAELP